MNASDARWLPTRTLDGSWTCVDTQVGEACHSLDGAWTQALERYARPCRLRELALAGRREISVLDVGAGLGTNLCAALAELEGTEAALEILSLERERGVLAAALALDERQPTHARAFELVRPAFERALASDDAIIEVALGARGRLRLALGDARATLAAQSREPQFDAVFLDPFSPRVAPDLWAGPFLADAAARMRPEALLSTYSSSFRVRLELARAGLQVGAGPRVGRKSSGTLASPAASPALKLPALDGRTARRIDRRLALTANPGSGRETEPGFA